MTPDLSFKMVVATDGKNVNVQTMHIKVDAMVKMTQGITTLFCNQNGTTGHLQQREGQSTRYR